MQSLNSSTTSRCCDNADDGNDDDDDDDDEVNYCKLITYSGILAWKMIFTYWPTRIFIECYVPFFRLGFLYFRIYYLFIYSFKLFEYSKYMIYKIVKFWKFLEFYKLDIFSIVQIKKKKKNFSNFFNLENKNLAKKNWQLWNFSSIRYSALLVISSSLIFALWNKSILSIFIFYFSDS